MGGPAASNRDEDGAVRKTVTALFCDLVGSTAFGEKVDPEAARDAMNRYFAMARAAIEANGGTVAKFIGDGVMAMWGVPQVAEDDAVRAVRAGLALQEAFAGIRDHIQTRHGVSVGLRVGINTGEVVIADADDDVVGDALNTAARLEAACTPGRVLVGEPTWRLSRNAVQYADHGVIQAKGKDEPVTAYEVVSVHDIDDPQTEPPFVGREAELRRLQVVMDEAILERSARLVTIIGSPGVGKTRLAQELRNRVEGGTLAFDLRCEREGMTTFAPVADLLRMAADITDAHSMDETRERIAMLVAPLEDAGRVGDLLAGFVGAGPTRSTEEMFLGVRRLFEILGATQPVVLVVDDIQWAEPLFVDLLEHLAEWVRGVPLLIVCLARPEIRDVRPPIAETGRRVAAVVALEGLDNEATHELAARLVGADSLPADLVAKIPETTQGNPLFVRELMRMLVDDGVIADRDGAWEMVIDVDAVDVPPTVNTLLASRVERLAPAERRALELASVVGSDFPLGAVAAAAGGTSGLADVFEHLRRKELIEPTGTYWGDEPVYRFHHVLIRDAAYRRLLKGNRAELHVRVGEWTEQTAVGLLGEHEVTIAHHYEQAYLLRHQLGLDDDETRALGHRSAALLRVAAERALEREDLSAAGSLASRAVACLEDDAPGTSDLLLTACEALLGTGHVTEGAAALDRLERVCGDDRRLRAWVDCFRAQLSIYTDPGALEDVARAAGTAADVLAGLDDQAGVAKARLQRAAALVRLGRVGDCEAELDAALTAARAADDRRRVTAVLGSAPLAALWGPSPVPRAGGRCLDVVRLLRITTGSPAVEATSIRCQAVLESLRGRHDTARSMLDSARRTLEEIGDDHGLMETSYFAGLVELLAGDPAAAEPHLRTAYDGLGKMGIGADAGQAAAYLARSLLLQGRLDEADDYAHESDALAGQNPQTAIVSRSVQAEVLAARGAFAEALALSDEAVHLAEGSDILVDHANAVAAQARVRAAAGDAAGASESAASAAALYEQKGAVVEIGVGDATTHDEGDRGGVGAVDRDGTHEAAPEFERLPAETSPTPDEPTWTGTFERMAVAHGHMTAGRVDEWAAMLSDDFVWVEERKGVRLETHGREQARETLQTILHEPDPDDDTPPAPRRADEEPPRLEITPVDGRGRNLALARVLTYAGGTSRFEREYLLLGQIDDEGLGILAMAFDVDDIEAATAELDRLHAAEAAAADPTGGWAESGDDASSDRVRSIAEQAMEQVMRASRRGAAAAVDAMRALALPTVSTERRRGLSFEFDSEAMFLALEEFRHAESLDIEVLGTRGARLLAARTRFAYTGGFVSERCSVIRVDAHGRWEHQVTVDTEAEAFAAMAELEADERRSTEVRNTASMVLERDLTDGANIDVYAVRDDHIALAEIWTTADDARLELVRVDVGGHVTERSVFAVDDLRATLRELDRWYIDDLGTHAPTGIGTFAAAVTTINPPDPTAMAALYADDIVVENEAAMAALTTGRGASDVIAQNAAFNVGVDSVVAKVLVVDDHALACLVQQGDRRAPGERWLEAQVTVVAERDGLITYFGTWSLDDLDEALAKYDSVAHPPPDPLAHRQFRSLDLANTATARYRADGHPDARVEAVNEEHLALVEDEDGYVVVDSRAAGELSLHRAADRSGGYLRLMELGYDEHDPDVDLRLLTELGLAALSHDRDRLEELLAPDFESDTHRMPQSLPLVSRAEMIDMNTSGEGLGLEEHPRKSIAVANGAWCGWMTSASDDNVASDFLALVTWDANHITGWTLYRLDQLDEALADFDAAAGDQRSLAERAQPHAPGEPSATRVPLNTAARAAIRLDRTLWEPNRTEWLATMADDVIVEDRQRLHRQSLRGKDEVDTAYRAIHGRADGEYDVETTTLAVRGDDLALCRTRVSEAGRVGREDADVFRDHLSVYRTDQDGRICRAITFDTDDVHAAWDELDRLWTRQVEGPERVLRAQQSDGGGAFRRLDWDRWRAGFHPAFTSDDRRAIGFGVSDLAGMAERNRALTDQLATGRVDLPVVHRFDSGVTAGVTRSEMTTKRGSTASIDMVYVTVNDLVNGGVTHNYQFDVDAVEAALELADGLIEERRRSIALTEPVAVGGVASARARESLDRFLTLVAEDFEAVLLDGSVVTRTDLAGGSVAPEALGFGHVDRTIVHNAASVGLFRIDAEGRDRWFSLEIVRDNQLLRVEQFAFADLLTAVDRFDEIDAQWWASHPEAATAMAGIRFRQGSIRRDTVELDAVTHDDFVVVDRRPLMYGTVTKADWLALLANMGDLPTPVLVGQVFGLADGAILFRGHQLLWTDGEWTPSNGGWMVLAVDGGRVRSLEVFPEDDADAAFARFEALRAEPAGAEESAVVRAFEAAVEAARAADYGGFTDLLAEDLQYRNDSVVPPAIGGKAELVEDTEAAERHPVSAELVIAAGANVAVCRLRSELAGDGDSGLDSCVLVGVGADGLIDRWHVRPIRDLRLALADAAEAHPEAAFGIIVHGNRHDREGLRNAITDDFTMVDHRANGLLGTMDGEAWLDAQFRLMDLSPDAAVWVDVVELRGDWLLMNAKRWDDPSTPPSWSFTVVIETIDGAWHRLDIYDELDVAREHFAECADADLAPGAPNAAS